MVLRKLQWSVENTYYSLLQHTIIIVISKPISSKKKVYLNEKNLKYVLYYSYDTLVNNMKKLKLYGLLDIKFDNLV